MQITINCDSDYIEIEADDPSKPPVKIPKPRTMAELGDLLYEVINACYGQKRIELCKQDEGVLRGVEEW